MRLMSRCLERKNAATKTESSPNPIISPPEKLRPSAPSTSTLLLTTA